MRTSRRGNIFASILPVAAVNLGGDADTIGAVFGQIAGAHYGFGAIPRRWLEKMKDRKDVDDLITAFLAPHAAAAPDRTRSSSARRPLPD